jgi:Small subunit of serine palmitoyltransferase-like
MGPVEFVKRTHFQLSLVTGSYMVTPWEQALVHTFVITVITVGGYYTVKGALLAGLAFEDFLMHAIGA